MRGLAKCLFMIAALAVPATGFAQTAAEAAQRQQDLTYTHSVLQKTGLGTLAVTGALGFALLANKETIFGDGLCAEDGSGVFGEFGCNGGMSIVHFVFAASTLGLFVASEVVAAKMDPSPYDHPDRTRAHAMDALRWTNVGLFALQPVLGLIAAHPGIVGVPVESRRAFSRVLRTVHVGVGLGLATTYSINAALQW